MVERGNLSSLVASLRYLVHAYVNASILGDDDAVLFMGELDFQR